MSVLHLRVGGPSIVNMDVVEKLQRLARDLINLAWQAANSRMLGDFEKAARAVGFI